MAYNYSNEPCWQCSELVYKGTGIRVFVKEAAWVTMCHPCGVARKGNQAKAARKRAAVRAMPTLFNQ